VERRITERRVVEPVVERRVIEHRPVVRHVLSALWSAPSCARWCSRSSMRPLPSCGSGSWSDRLQSITPSVWSTDRLRWFASGWSIDSSHGSVSRGADKAGLACPVEQFRCRESNRRSDCENICIDDWRELAGSG
jgi:hypothetical protein